MYDWAAVLVVVEAFLCDFMELIDQRHLFRWLLAVKDGIDVSLVQNVATARICTRRTFSASEGSFQSVQATFTANPNAPCMLPA